MESRSESKGADIQGYRGYLVSQGAYNQMAGYSSQTRAGYFYPQKLQSNQQASYDQMSRHSSSQAANPASTSQNSRFLHEIYSHPHYYIVDPQTPNFPVTPDNFVKFMDLYKELLHGYNQMQHGGVKLCTFCFCWVSRKLKYDFQVREPDEVEPEYTMVEVLGKMDQSTSSRYNSFCNFLNHLQKIGYRPLCRLDPTGSGLRDGSSHTSRKGGRTAPPNFVPLEDSEWVPHFPKFTCGLLVHKCYNHYMNGGLGAMEAIKAKHLARMRVRARRSELLPGGPESPLGMMIGLHPALASYYDSKMIIPTDRLEKIPKNPPQQKGFFAPVPLNLVENQLIAKAIDHFGFQKLVVIPNGAVGPIRVNLRDCKFYTNPLLLETEKIRRWTFYNCTGHPIPIYRPHPQYLTPQPELENPLLVDFPQPSDSQQHQRQQVVDHQEPTKLAEEPDITPPLKRRCPTPGKRPAPHPTSKGVAQKAKSQRQSTGKLKSPAEGSDASSDPEDGENSDQDIQTSKNDPKHLMNPPKSTKLEQITPIPEENESIDSDRDSFTSSRSHSPESSQSARKS